MYAVITDFSLQYQRSEKTGTELGTACRLRCRCRMPLAMCGEGHTNGRDRRRQPGPFRIMLAPVHRLRRRPRPRASARSGTHDTVHPSRYGPRPPPRGRWGLCGPVRSDVIRLGAAPRSMRPRAPPRKAHAAILLPPGPGGPAGAWRAYAILAGEGCAGRFATGRGVDRAGALSNRPGLRVPATPSGRGGRRGPVDEGR